MTQKKKVLFLCTHNAVRSQMAEGILRTLYGENYEVYSAGTQPTQLHPYAVKVLKEIGIDISHQYAKSIESLKHLSFDYIVTVCESAKEQCPYFPKGSYYLHHSFEDPLQDKTTEEEQLNRFRIIRDAIKQWIEETFNPFNTSIAFDTIKK